MELEVVRGDLSETESDVLVVTAGADLNMSSAVATDIRAECDGPVQSRLQRHEEINEGNVLVTDGFNLSSYLFHTITTPEHRTREQNVRLAISEALNLADRLGCQSLATPMIGSGYGEVDTTVVAKIIGETVDAHIPTHLSEVQLVCLSQDAYTTAQSVCNRNQSPWVAR